MVALALAMGGNQRQSMVGSGHSQWYEVGGNYQLTTAVEMADDSMAVTLSGDGGGVAMISMMRVVQQWSR